MLGPPNDVRAAASADDFVAVCVVRHGRDQVADGFRAAGGVDWSSSGC